jgi:hypothetical protein
MAEETLFDVVSRVKSDPFLDAYLAGIFDGEGCVTICMMGGKARRQPMHALNCIVAMTCREIPYLLQDRFGGNVLAEKVRGANRQPSWRWRTHGWHAVDFLRDVLPYLRVKRKQAELAIEFQTTKKRYKGIPAHEMLRRDSFRRRIWALNGYKQIKRRPILLADCAFPS